MCAASPAPEFPRQYVAVDADLGTWEAAEPYFKELDARAIASLAEFEQWLLDWSELVSCTDEEGTLRQVLWTCQTDDEQRFARYMDYVQNVAPKSKPWHDKLNRKFAAHAKELDLPAKRYAVLERSIRNTIELYREENIPLSVKNEELSSEYQQLMAAMTCTYDGREQTFQQMERYLEEPERRVREEAWRQISGRHMQDVGAIDQVFEQMVAVRHEMARNAGFDEFRGFMFRAMERFDYTPEDCLAFHDAIEQVVLPAVRVQCQRRREKLGLETLRPWDMAVDPDQRPPLRPFQNAEELVKGCSRVFHQVEPDLGQIFDTLSERKTLDLETRKGKAPGGYQATFPERRLPFIFMNAAGTETDVRTLLHEGGHAFHTWASRNEPLVAYRGAPIEFCEVASMGMECLALPYTKEFFGEDSGRATRRFFEKIILFFPFMAAIDAFQHHVYTHIDQGIEGWKNYWVSLAKRFSPEVDLGGLEAQTRAGWQRKLHIFEVPFYYVEYGIAQLGALQVWMNARKDRAQAIAQYRYGLALGGSRPLPELFEAAGCKFDFSEKTLRPLIDAVMEEIDRL